MIGPKARPIFAVPSDCAANSPARITTAAGRMNGVKAWVTTLSPSRALSTEIAGVMTESPRNIAAPMTPSSTTIGVRRPRSFVSQFRRLRDAAIAIALLAVPFFVLNANLHEPGRDNWYDTPILEASTPIQSLASGVAHAVSDFLDDYVFLVEVREENDRLRARLARLESEHEVLTAEALENRRLRSLLSLRERLGGQVIAAQVIGRDVSPFFRVTRIEVDRGERDHVAAGMPVVSARGLVGQIRRSFGRYSDVLLAVDAGSAVDVIVQRTGARGMLRGTGEDDGAGRDLEVHVMQHLAPRVVTPEELFPVKVE